MIKKLKIYFGLNPKLTKNKDLCDKKSKKRKLWKFSKFQCNFICNSSYISSSDINTLVGKPVWKQKPHPEKSKKLANWRKSQQDLISTPRGIACRIRPLSIARHSYLAFASGKSFCLSSSLFLSGCFDFFVNLCGGLTFMRYARLGERVC